VSRPDLHEHSDFRVYLRSMFEWQRRRRNPAFLQREILKRMGVSSTGFLSNVLAGRKNLSPTQIRRLVEVMELSDSDALYFEALVHLGQARDDLERKDWLERLAQLRSVPLDTLPESDLGFFSRSEAVFLYELLTFTEFDGDAESLGRRFDPPVSGDRIRQALEILQSVGLLERDSKGKLRTRSHAVSSGPSPSSDDLVRFHQRCMALARRSLRTCPQAQRDLSVLTLGLSEDGFRRARAEIAHFRRRLVAIALEETEPDRVYQLNFHLFPVTRPSGGEA
jgi:uncharacterized protein (TIGR02147 family)